MISPKIWIALGAVGIVLTTITGAYVKGRGDESLAAQAQARREIVEQLTERNLVNEAVSGMSSADLCRKLGGVFESGLCE